MPVTPNQITEALEAMNKVRGPYARSIDSLPEPYIDNLFDPQGTNVLPDDFFEPFGGYTRDEEIFYGLDSHHCEVIDNMIEVADGCFACRFERGHDGELADVAGWRFIPGARIVDYLYRREWEGKPLDELLVMQQILEDLIDAARKAALSQS